MSMMRKDLRSKLKTIPYLTDVIMDTCMTVYIVSKKCNSHLWCIYVIYITVKIFHKTFHIEQHILFNEKSIRASGYSKTILTSSYRD